MLVLALTGGLFLCLTLLLREVQLARERRALSSKIRQQHARLQHMQSQLQETRDDLFVMQRLLMERNLYDEAAFARAREQLIEQPRLKATSEQAQQSDADLGVQRIILAGNPDKIH
mgnify:CR=1 FL=1